MRPGGSRGRAARRRRSGAVPALVGDPHISRGPTCDRREFPQARRARGFPVAADIGRVDERHRAVDRAGTNREAVRLHHQSRWHHPTFLGISGETRSDALADACGGSRLLRCVPDLAQTAAARAARPAGNSPRRICRRLTRSRRARCSDSRCCAGWPARAGLSEDTASYIEAAARRRRQHRLDFLHQPRADRAQLRREKRLRHRRRPRSGGAWCGEHRGRSCRRASP